jgi:hypothetical protein
MRDGNASQALSSLHYTAYIMHAPHAAGAAVAHEGIAAISSSSSLDDCSSFVCNECGLVTTTVSELQLHMVRKTAWSNAGLIGCRVSCLIDSREWQEAIVVAFQRCSSSSNSSADCDSTAAVQPQHISGFAGCSAWRSGKHLLQLKGSEKRWM